MLTLPLVTDAAEIATDRYPLRASALPKINECPASVFLSEKFWLLTDDDEDSLGGEAAQTGNLVHEGATLFHTVIGSVEERTEAGLRALRDAREKFPGGDAKRAKKIFEAYAEDRENQEATVIKVEQRVYARLAPAPFDPTGKPVVIKGKLDQIRIINGVPTVWDIKTGKMYYGQKALDHYMTQQAAYTVAAQQTWGQEFLAAGLSPVEPGGLLCTDGYFRPQGRVQWHHKWGVDDIELILQNVVNQVAAARAKRLGFAPSTDACRWCEHKNFSSCKSFFQDHVH